jgi:hypothetical protein
MRNLLLNDQGGVTYASQQLVSQEDQRSEVLADVRVVADGLQELCAEIRKSWPERYPMPADLDAILKFQDYALARLRAGSLRMLAEACKRG